MKRFALFLVLASGSVAAANAACSNDNPATGGNSPGLPGSSLPGVDAGKTDGGITITDGGGGVVDSGPIDAGPALCDPTILWTSNGRLPALDTSSLAQFGAVSGTELSLAWTKANGDLYVADRPDTDTDFSAATKVDTGTTAIANDRVALSPTGQAIIAMTSARTQFVEFDRATATSTTWTKASANRFTQITAFLSESTGQLSEPVMGADKLTLYFLITTTGNAPALYESRYNAASSQWASPGSLLATALQSADATHRRRPTGASSDRRTLFFFDETTLPGIERAAWRNTPDQPFSKFVDMTGFNETAPNTACDTLYFQGTDVGGAGVFT
ncbi:MAG: hypothetical protein ABI461_04370, partial [Polyangiaceae bacterium]